MVRREGEGGRGAVFRGGGGLERLGDGGGRLGGGDGGGGGLRRDQEEEDYEGLQRILKQQTSFLPGGLINNYSTSKKSRILKWKAPPHPPISPTETARGEKRSKGNLHEIRKKCKRISENTRVRKENEE